MKLSHFKKIHEDDKIAVMQHPDGHKIHIAKRALSGAMKHKLKALPLHMSKGGLSSSDDSDDSDDDTQNSAPQSSAQPLQNDTAQQGRQPAGFFSNALDTIGNLFSGDAPLAPPTDKDLGEYGPPASLASKPPEVFKNSPMPVDQQKAPAETQPAAQPPSQIIAPPESGAKTAVPYLKASITAGEKAIEENKAVQTAEGPALRQAYDENSQELLNSAQNNVLTKYGLQNHADALMDDMNSGKINPNRVFQNMSTLQKVGMTAGLLFGGIGSAYTGQPNPAHQYLQKLIENDINAQKDDLARNGENSRSMLNFYNNQMNNLPLAENATRATLQQIIGNQIKAIGSANSDQRAQAAADDAYQKLYAAGADTFSKVQTQLNNDAYMKAVTAQRNQENQTQAAAPSIQAPSGSGVVSANANGEPDWSRIMHDNLDQLHKNYANAQMTEKTDLMNKEALMKQNPVMGMNAKVRPAVDPLGGEKNDVYEKDLTDQLDYKKKAERFLSVYQNIAQRATLSGATNPQNWIKNELEGNAEAMKLAKDLSGRFSMPEMQVTGSTLGTGWKNYFSTDATKNYGANSLYNLFQANFPGSSRLDRIFGAGRGPQIKMPVVMKPRPGQ